MNTSIESVEETIRELLAKRAPGDFDATAGGVPDIDSDTDLAADLSLDSFAMMEFLMEIEDHYDIIIDLKSVSDAHTLGDLARAVVAEMGA